MLPVVFGCQGHVLSDEERNFFRSHQPAGLIVFDRNIATARQLTQLVDDFLSCLEHPHGFVTIDQEGGRVQRLRPPCWHQWPSAETIGSCYHKNSQSGLALAAASARTIAATLVQLGIHVNLSPVVDVLDDCTHQVIGDRAFSRNPQVVATLGSQSANAMLACGVIPVIKHIPGHGLAQSDSHRQLPVVTASITQLQMKDCYPFSQLADLPMAMTAHIVYQALDALPATLSKTTLSWIRSEIGFAGLLISDCIHMRALSGSLAKRAYSAQQAGIDLVLASHADIRERTLIAQAVQPASKQTLQRLDTAIKSRGSAQPQQSDWKLVEKWCVQNAGTDPTAFAG